MTARTAHTALVPSYVARFECLGGACPDTCCAGWRVDVDKATYKKLRGVRIPVVAELARKHLKRGNGDNTRQFAHIGMSERLQCPIQTADRLCTIQQELDHTYLPRVCADYPRAYHRVGDHNEVFMTLSCPEAARLALLDPKAHEATTTDLPFPSGKPVPYGGGFGGDFGLQAHPVRRNFNAIREFYRATLRERSHPLWQRLLLLGLVAQKIDALVKEATPDSDAAIEKTLLEARLSLLSGEFRQQTEGLAGRHGDAVARQVLLKKMTDVRIRPDAGQQYVVINTEFLNAVESALTGIRFDAEDLGGSAERFQQAHDAWFAPCEARHPHILENYLLNEIGNQIFPGGVGQGVDMTTEWSRLMITYAMIRFYLVGLAGRHGAAFGPDHYVRLIYSFARAIQHNKTFMPRVYEFFDREGINSFATLVILIR